MDKNWVITLMVQKASHSLFGEVRTDLYAGYNRNQWLQSEAKGALPMF
jgi:hypothetical protein